MKNKFSILENEGIKITLGSNGMTPAGRFFIVLSLLFIGFLSYAIIAYSRHMLVTINSVSAFVIMAIVLAASLILFLVAYSLSFEKQEISIVDKVLVIKKFRPIWPGSTKTIKLENVDGFAMEKLGFSFMNVWYAFIFHKDFGADDVENFTSPQVRFAGNSISFLEYADESNKKMALEKLKKGTSSGLPISV